MSYWSVQEWTCIIFVGGAGLAFCGMYLLISHKCKCGYTPNRRSTDK